MMSQARRIADRRARVRALREQGFSVREIAERLRVSKSTVSTDVVAGSERGRLVPNAAAPGNERAVKSGVYSERRIAPCRERHARDLAERYPDLDPGRRCTEAQRRAMIELASDWIDDRGTVVHGEGRTFDIAVKLAGWLTSSERWQERVQDELRQPNPTGGVEALIERGREIIELREVDDGERS
jgi:transposase